MRYLCVFVFHFANNKKLRIVTRSMKQAMQTFNRLTSSRYPVTLIEVQIRVTFIK